MLDQPKPRDQVVRAGLAAEMHRVCTSRFRSQDDEAESPWINRAALGGHVGAEVMLEPVRSGLYLAGAFARGYQSQDGVRRVSCARFVRDGVDDGPVRVDVAGYPGCACGDGSRRGRVLGMMYGGRGGTTLRRRPLRR